MNTYFIHGTQNTHLIAEDKEGLVFICDGNHEVALGGNHPKTIVLQRRGKLHLVLMALASLDANTARQINEYVQGLKVILNASSRPDNALYHIIDVPLICYLGLTPLISVLEEISKLIPSPS